MKTTSAVAAAFLAAHAAATSPFKSPANSDNHCNDAQKSGFDWSNLPTGPVGSYNGFSFSGFTCTDKFGKPDALTKRAFQDRAIAGQASKSSGPSFSCDGDKKFSISEMHVSSDVDTDIELNYGMPDGAICKQTVPCKPSGSVVKNTQCGGAKDVTVKLPPSASKESCNIGFHSIGFDCAPPANTLGHLVRHLQHFVEPVYPHASDLCTLDDCNFFLQL
ncbi:hypothetical protein LTS18_004082 [Coniosporium uncinatum]|uniref:Uncharacterized protein n=1 Tax=Coniosporium uncinatum TaxID=93489 RepID=A0ACC3DSG2_9PEZI|nr:hypothetical protein LTS18_004082 [Coniosporium uncinatum]